MRFILLISMLIVPCSIQAMEVQELITPHMIVDTPIFYLSEGVREDLEKKYSVKIPPFDPSLVCYKKINPDPRGTILPLSFIFNKTPFRYENITQEIIIGSSKYKLVDNPEHKASILEYFKKAFKYFKKDPRLANISRSHNQELYDHKIIQKVFTNNGSYIETSFGHGPNSRLPIYIEAMQEAEQYEKLKREEEEKECKRLATLAPIASRLQTYITIHAMQTNPVSLVILVREQSLHESQQ